MLQQLHYANVTAMLNWHYYDMQTKLHHARIISLH